MRFKYRSLQILPLALGMMLAGTLAASAQQDNSGQMPTDQSGSAAAAQTTPPQPSEIEEQQIESQQTPPQPTPGD